MIKNLKKLMKSIGLFLSTMPIIHNWMISNVFVFFLWGNMSESKWLFVLVYLSTKWKIGCYQLTATGSSGLGDKNYIYQHG